MAVSNDAAGVFCLLTLKKSRMNVLGRPPSGALGIIAAPDDPFELELACLRGYELAEVVLNLAGLLPPFAASFGAGSKGAMDHDDRRHLQAPIPCANR